MKIYLNKSTNYSTFDKSEFFLSLDNVLTISVILKNSEKRSAVLLNLQSLLEKSTERWIFSVLSSFFISHFILLPLSPLKPVLKEALGLSVICSGSALIPHERRGIDGAPTHWIYMVTAKRGSLSSWGSKKGAPGKFLLSQMLPQSPLSSHLSQNLVLSCRIIALRVVSQKYSSLFL